MKKLVTVFALCAAVSVYAQVQSANIVGYQKVNLNVGKFTHVSPSFIKIGGAVDFKISDIQGDMAELDSIQFMDNLSATANEYFWLVEGSLSVGATGWYAADGETPAGDTIIPKGTSVLYSSQGSTEVTFVGEVNTLDVTVDTGSGFTPVGNPFPVDTTLDGIQFVGISELSSVQFMSDIAATDSEYFWLVEGSLSAGLTGWYAADGETPAGDTVVAAGKGFLFSEQGTTTAITFSTPL